MGHGVGSYLGLNEIRSLSSMMIFIIISYLFFVLFVFICLGFLLLPINNILCYYF